MLPENYFSKSKVNIKTLNITINKVGYKYLLLTEFKGPTVSYRPSFFCSDLWPKHEMPRPYIMWKKQGSVTYSTDQEKEVSKMFIISLG